MQVCLWVKWCFSWQKDNGYPEECLSPVTMRLEESLTLGKKEKDISSTV